MTSLYQKHRPPKGPSWPTDPQQVARMERIAHYLRLGYSFVSITAALKRDLPPALHIEPKDVAREARKLLQIWKANANRDSQEVFGEIEMMLRHAAAKQMELFELSRIDRVLEAVDPNTGRTADGRNPTVMPASTHIERSRILANYHRAVLALSMHHFGRDAGVKVFVDASKHQTNNVVGVVTPEAARALLLREQAGEIAQLLQDGMLLVREPYSAPEPSRRSDRDVRQREVVQPNEETVDMQRQLEAVAAASGLTGRTEQGEEAEERGW